MQNPDPVCPPHHWMITEQAGPLQQWQCLRCGEAREQDPAPAYTYSDSYQRGHEQARLARQNKKAKTQK
jgi:hypothetical protein